LTISSAVSLRRERTVEVEQVNSLAVEAFGRPVLGSLLTSLRSSPAWVGGLSFVATEGDRVVGHVLFSRGWVDAPRELVDVLVLSPLAVAPKWQGRGIGSALVRHGLEQIDSRREPLVFLEGSPRFYPRFGFEPAGPLGFLRPSPRIPEAAFMAQRTPSYEPWMTGTLVYPDAFWRHDCVGRRDS
jgi:putative acetyltransferase